MQALTILIEDSDIVAIEKPAGLAAIPGRGENDSVLQRLSAQLGQRVLVVHRLDKDTSGVMLFAKHTEAQRFISHQFQNNTVEKEYLALVGGKVPQAEGDIDSPIGVHPGNKRKMSVLKHGGRPARTLWKIEERFRDFTLLRVFPKTGKTHQIRVHLTHIGCPLAIDPLYNPTAGPILLSRYKRGYRAKHGAEERPLIDRLPLHAEKLRFTNIKGERMEIVCAVPKDLRVACSQLAKHNRG